MNAPTSLCPGYKQVESFGNDEDYESEEGEEVSYVTLDIGDVEPQLVPSSATYRLIGLDTPTPYLQCQGTVLKGRHDFLMGTELIFTDDKETNDRNKRSVIHIANTEQRIAFQEVTLIPKTVSDKAKKHKATLDFQDDSLSGPSGITSSDFQPPIVEDHAAEIDRLTGVTSPLTRAPRKRKEKSSSSSKKKNTTAKKATTTTAPRKSKRAKGKEKEKDIIDINDDEGANDIDPKDIEDIYMDADY